MSKLTDEELADAIEEYRIGRCLGQPHQYIGMIHAALIELRELRALLATPMPAKHEGADEAYEAPYHFGGHISARWIAHDLHIDDALALGAALIRAALAARGGRR